ncbi:MAG: hypothetical protein BGO49_13865 [Planctomycetales bacterium 71-10]|mgnify:CR=1 FL=1|nr:MAG: hypothetical protein BGO49_13865 [Planctomycetales bacterium 71-10]
MHVAATMIRFLRSARVPALASALILAAASARAGGYYKVTPVGSDNSLGSGINNSGQMVGSDRNPQGWGIPFLYDSRTGVTTYLNVRGGLGQAAAINDAGSIVGSTSPTLTAFLYRNGSFAYLDGAAVTASSAAAINGSNAVVGEARRRSDGNIHAFRYQAGVVTDLGTLGGDYSGALGINDAGQVVGYSRTASGPIRGFLYENGVMKILGTLGGDYSNAQAINEAGDIAGGSTTASGDNHAFLDRQGVMLDLGTLGGTYSFASGLNDAGQVVGMSSVASGAYHGFVYSNGMMLDLNSLIDPDSGWVIYSANGINNSGQIVANASRVGDPTFPLRAVLLTPTAVPEPSGLALIAAGASGLALAARRRRGGRA